MWRLITASWIFMLAALPATTNYKLNSYGLGSGGQGNATTTTYALEGISGETSGQTMSTANAKDKPGYIETQQANVPKIANFDNNGGTYYNKLHFVIDTQGNPTDAKYALQISTDNFGSDIRYVKSDLTVGSTLTTADYQTYTTWGGAGGAVIIGLAYNTTYYLRAKATQGEFTESAYGPTATATTANETLSFSISPNSISFGNLPPGSVTDAPSSITVSLDTNAASGSNVFVYGVNGGLKSTAVTYTITSATADLAVAAEGFGAQSTGTSQSSGGPLTAQSPYNGSAQNVGIINSTIRPIYATTGPIGTGSGTVLLKAKPAATTPAATDYQEILTMVAAAVF
jgi:hypothetical protein